MYSDYLKKKKHKIVNVFGWPHGVELLLVCTYISNSVSYPESKLMWQIYFQYVNYVLSSNKIYSIFCKKIICKSMENP